MHHFDENIEQWRRELLQAQTLSEEDVEELVDHLEQTVFDLCESGLSKAEAYWVARSRLGDVQVLQVEYYKVNQTLVWRKRIAWLLSGYFLFAAIPPLIKILVMPIHVWEIDRLLAPASFLFGSEFQVPYALFLAVLFAAGWFLVTLNSGKSSLSEYVGRLKFGPQLIAWLLAGYGFIMVTQLVLTTATARFNSMETVGNIAASGSIFRFLWQLFLIVALVMILVFMNRENGVLQTT